MSCPCATKCQASRVKNNSTVLPYKCNSVIGSINIPTEDLSYHIFFKSAQIMFDMSMDLAIILSAST